MKKFVYYPYIFVLITLFTLFAACITYEQYLLALCVFITMILIIVCIDKEFTEYIRRLEELKKAESRIINAIVEEFDKTFEELHGGGNARRLVTQFRGKLLDIIKEK